MNLDDLLSHLEAVQLIRPDDDNERSFIFKNALTQDAAYESLLRSTRADWHRQVGEAIEQLSPDQLEENAAVLALHFDRAKASAKAFEYAARAGDAARRKYAHAEAIAFYDLALETANRLNDANLNSRVRALYVNRGNVFEVAGNFPAAIENYRAMIAFAQRAGDLIFEADAVSHLVTTQAVMKGATPELKEELDQALALAKKSGDEEQICRALWNMGLALRFQESDRALNYFQQALELARSAKLVEMTGFTLVDLMGQMRVRGEWKQGREYAREALEIFRALDNKPMIADVLGASAFMLFNSGEREIARAAATEGAAICTAIDNPWGLHVCELNLLEMEFFAGELENTLNEGEQLLARARRIAFPLFSGLSLTTLARANLELNQFARAQEQADESVKILDGMKTTIWTTYARGVEGLVAIARGELERARALLQPLWHEGDNPIENFYGFIVAGPAIAEWAIAEKRFEFGREFCDWLIRRYEQQEMALLAAEMIFLRAKIYSGLDQHSRALSDLHRAHEICERSGNKILLWRVDAALANVYAKTDERERAREARQNAAELVSSLIEKIADRELRESFLQRDDVMKLLQG